MEKRSHDLVVIGAGPGGYVAAIRAAQLGMDVACVERFERLGGTCLNVGCIPSKALLEASARFVGARDGLAAFGVRAEGVSIDVAAMQKRKEAVVDGLAKGVAFLFKKNKISRYQGAARLDGPGRVIVDGAEPLELAAKWILVATGSKPTTIPGVALDGDRVGTSTTALAYAETPRRLVVIGAGTIGLELGSIWRRLGSEVTVVEPGDRVLPELDGELSRQALRLLKRQGLAFHLASRVLGARVEGGECVVEVEGVEPLRADRVLVATPRAARTDGLGLAEAGVRLTAAGCIDVDGDFRSSAPGVYAVGDVIGGALLAHKASAEGVACVERLAGLPGPIDYDAIPFIAYTAPEIASVGKAQEALEKAGVPFKTGSFPFKANGRALAHGDSDGLVKILAHAETDALLGIHVVGPWASELVGQGAVAMSARMTSAAFARVCAAHPTLSEALHEAALAVAGRAIHG
jgi:dihydrolipoamide dehydrogenase